MQLKALIQGMHLTSISPEWKISKIQVQCMCYLDSAYHVSQDLCDKLPATALLLMYVLRVLATLYVD
jgi:hypothetical protein